MCSMKKSNRTNNFSICTLDNNSDCEACRNKEKLSCKWDKGLKNTFAVIGSAPVLITLLGLSAGGILTGIWWPIPAYIAYAFIMFNIFEIRFLCSHCPYYPDGGNTLRCLANHGSPKLWKYHPEPMNAFEKFMMRIGVMGMIFYILPVVLLLIAPVMLFTGEQGIPIQMAYVLLLFIPSELISAGSFLKTVQTFYCTKCVNFSCPYNKVPKPTVDAYLEKNVIMREAWEKSGYRLG